MKWGQHNRRVVFWLQQAALGARKSRGRILHWIIHTHRTPKESPLPFSSREDFVDLVRQERRCCRKLASYRERDWSCFTWEPCVKLKHNQKDCTLPLLILLGNSSSILPVPLLTFLAFTDTDHTFCSAEMHSLLYILVMTWGWTENLLLLCTDAYSERVTSQKLT